MGEVRPDSDPPEAVAGFRVAGLRIDPESGSIGGPGGTEQLDPKVMAVLCVLARTPGVLVLRSQLLTEIWPGANVYDDALTQCVYQLRQHLVAAGGSDRFRGLVKTLPKRGYVLAAEVEPVNPILPAVPQPAPEPAPKPQRSPVSPRFAAAVGVLLMTAVLVAFMILSGGEEIIESAAPPPLAAPTLIPNSIAVLPFVNQSNDPANDYISDGLSDQLRDRLSELRDWRVVARRSSVRLRHSKEDARAIGHQLGVSRIIDGRFDRDGDRIIVSAELVDASTGFQLWTRNYTRDLREVLLVEQYLARDLLHELAPLLSPDPEPAGPSPQQVAAHDLMLLGRQYEQQVVEEQRVDGAKLARVIELYSRAVELDPASAEAHARLGRMLLYRGEVTRAEPHILEALKLAPERADTFATLGLYYWSVREDGVGAAYQRAIELNPSDADALSYYAAWAWVQGDAEGAVRHYRAALEVDPLSLVRYADLGYKLAFQGSHAEALAVRQRLVELFPTAPGYQAAGRITEALGDLDEAVAWTLKARALRPKDPDVNGQLAELLARLGEFEAAAQFEPALGLGQLFWQRRYNELVDQGEDLLFEPPVQPDTYFLLAFGYSALGRQKEATESLELGGLPATVLSESRRAADLHAVKTYIGALYEEGRVEDARAMAEWSLDFNQRLLATEGVAGWLPRLGAACYLAVLDRPKEALGWLETLPPLRTLTWLPWLQDLACFDSLKGEPRYAAVVRALELRVAKQRSRLSETLARHDVVLEVAP